MGKNSLIMSHVETRFSYFFFFGPESYELHVYGLIDVFEEKSDNAVTQVSGEEPSKH